MHIIKMLIILITKENTAITMIAGILGTANFEGDIKAADLQVLDQGDMPWASDRWLILATSRGNFDR